MADKIVASMYERITAIISKPLFAILFTGILWLAIYQFAMTVQELETNSAGVSWALDKGQAEFFANKYQRNFDVKKFS
jgi:hypothetical protein